MLRFMFKSKIHRATVTHANVDYEGSLTVDADLLKAADILPYEEIHVWNISRGTRFRTCALSGESGSGMVCVNGAGAHLVSVGDLVMLFGGLLIVAICLYRTLRMEGRLNCKWLKWILRDMTSPTTFHGKTETS